MYTNVPIHYSILLFECQELFLIILQVNVVKQTVLPVLQAKRHI